MVFVETPIFTKQLSAYLSDNEYRNLQNFLIENPYTGDVIQETGGLRKLRWKIGNQGKRGGLRVIYYYQKANDQIYFMTLYAKNEMANLSAQEKKILKQMIERWQ